MLRLIIWGSHDFYHKYKQNLIAKTPLKDTKAVANKASLIIESIKSLSIFTVFYQHLFSLERPLTSFMAADNLFSQAKAFSLTSAFCVIL